MNERERVEAAATWVRKKTSLRPKIALISGTGMERMPQLLNSAVRFDYNDIPYATSFEKTFHPCAWHVGQTQGVSLLVMQGRLHHYEGYTMTDLARPVRIAHALGVRGLVLCNAAGSLTPRLPEGHLMLAKDHLNLMPDSPVRGQEALLFGSPFVDLCEAYDSRWRAILLNTADELDLPLKEGVYVAVPGPHLETETEYQHLANMGAAAVGMSSVPEVIAARQLNMTCAMLSIISDEGFHRPLKKLNIDNIFQTLQQTEPQLRQLIDKSLVKLSSALQTA